MNRSLLASLGSTLLLGAATLVSTSCAGPDGTTGSVAAALQAAPTVTVAASGNHPLDTAPSKNGGTFYFIGSDRRGPGVFSVNANGQGNPVHDVTSGGPLVAPNSLAASLSGRLYVADPGADAIFVMGAHNGGVQDTLAAGNHPRGVDLAASCGDDETLYFTGTDARSGKPGLFRVDERGRSVAIATGAPFSNPGAVAVSHDGVAYVSDTPGVPGAGRILVLNVAGHGSVSVLATGLSLGDPAGVALTLDDSTLLVSGHDGNHHSQVYLIDTGTGAISTFNGGGIGNSTAAGGVHRAADRDVFGWADLSAGTAGTVYKIGLSARAYANQ